ncbi:C6 finger domain protein, putative [Talaromyces stipitatus ATCC 10500]|uniref:C6 finger domain protein, putative n=1 Tax=Talaromyces stipitatus (strain ATCC 10500 / CBS 375.48 / QM 6759 / NRRL 1006) TaxID=441959 RepID=B8M9Z4_TALSN|nr:C6 finger domain protein, putative [Talaromyces stipitatus ATCC 10500]EED18146.1 C6 finger domain protein, putative [Talaromyces stipitatus ATCC 10500]
MFHQWQQHDPEQRPRVARTRTGCLTCRRRKVRCNEVHPKCGHCSRLHLSCNWPPDSSFIIPGTIKVSKTKSKSRQDSREKRLSQQQPQAKSKSQSPLQKQQRLSLVQEQVEQPSSFRQQLLEHSDTQTQLLPEADFSEIFNYASFLWDNDSPTISFPTGSSPLDSLHTPHDQLQLVMPLADSDAMRRTTSTAGPPLFVSDRWVSDNGNFIPGASGVNVNESELSDFFARSTAPPILAPLETNSRWSRMRKMLIYMGKKSQMVKNAVMAFAALQFESPRSGCRTIHTQYYSYSRDMLTKILADVSIDQKLLAAELRHILATVFLLTYIDLLDDDVLKAHGNLRDAFHVIQRVRYEDLSLTEKCLLSWLRLLDGRAVSAGGEGLFLDEDDNNIPPDMESPPDTVDGGLENPETILEEVLTRPASSFFQKVQSFMGRISRIDPWHRSRGTVDDETEVMIIAQKISKDIKALWHQRPALMDHAIACKLVPPLLSPSLTNTLSRALMVCYANYHACFVHLHRVAYKTLPRTPDLETALCAIQQVTENLMRTPIDTTGAATTNSIEAVSNFTSDPSPLPINMLWPLLMLGVESDDAHQRAWVIAAMKSMESIVSNAGITADVLEEVIRRQDEAGQRMDIRQVMYDTFTRAFAIV